MNLEVNQYLWSDSQIVLCWINTHSTLLQTFVSNRVSEIQQLTDPNNWYYVNTKENLADIASRGLYPEQILQAKLWWNSPSWLGKQKTEWPTQVDITIDTPELKGKKKTALIITEGLNLINKFSNLTKLKRVTAYCLRFILNTRKHQEERRTGELTVKELEDSLKLLIKLSQNDSFREEIKILKNKQCLPKHKLQALTPFLDSDEIIRVGERLKNSHLKFDSKHPILLNGKHNLTKLIFENEHKALLHAGPQLLLSTVRQTFWPTSGMNVAKSVVRKCIRCYRFKPKVLTPQMAHLPEKRVTVMQPFYVSGVDYAGPFFIKERKGRNFKLSKAYICIFICFTSKAVHLELVTELTSEAFIAALRRCISRRGRPAHIYSDNGTNFTGAQKELRLLQEFLTNKQSDIIQYCSNENITWHFIPPNSPHFGGLWESNIKSMKHHLLRVINDTKLTYEEFLTILIQVEATLNSRPLYEMSNDPNDLQPLTPSHFLIGKPLVVLPNPNITDLPSNRLSRFQLLQQMFNSFWNRWSKEYLNHLQQRSKWKVSSENIKINTMVLIKQDNISSCDWLLGRIIDVHPGDDNIARVVSIKTSRGIIKRGVNKVCPLPFPDSEKEDSVSGSDNMACQ